MTGRASRTARWSMASAAIGVVLLALGPIAIQLGAASAFIGFRLFLLGTLLGLTALLLGILGLWSTRAAADRSGRGQAVTGAFFGAAIILMVLVTAGSAGNLPAINDITTDPDDPPSFRAAAELEANAGRDMSYPGESFASQQRDAYPDIEPIRLALPPDRAFTRAEAAVDALGWELTASDAGSGILEARDTTRVFRFVDDVVIRVRPANGGSVVDVRSKSRDGRGDLGTNAARIRSFRSAVTGSTSVR